MADLFSGLFFRHDRVLCDLFRTPVNRIGNVDQTFLEEPCSDIVVQHPDDGLNDIRFGFPGRCRNVSL